MIFYNEKSNIKIVIDEFIIKDIEDECNKSEDNETGGILIGYYTDAGNCAVVCSATGPPLDSRHNKSTFKRGKAGLMELLNKKWSELRQYYLGEWHYHPNYLPTPSRVDNMQMLKLAKNKDLKCPEPILLIVGGNKIDGWLYGATVYQHKEIMKFVQIKE